ncbi:MAG: cob(I)yrinic acid a,c-diamide adenosyltransferase [Calditrichaceae bacterium]
MKIYTGFGDKGKTSLFGGEVVNKNNPRIETYGTLDELNSLIGFLVTKNTEKYIQNILLIIQNEIFVLSSEIATPDTKRQKKLKNLITDKDIENIEKNIDEISEKLEPLKNFILPGGSESAAIAHLARTVCRRAERNLTKLMDQAEVRGELLVYINRLSDLFFVIARYLNKLNNQPDIVWKSKS